MADLEPFEADLTDQSDPLSSLTELQAILIGEHTVESILGLVAKLSHRTLRGAVASSVTVRAQGLPFTSNYSNELALDLDNFQYAVGRGPCLAALEQGVQINEPVADHPEWEEFRTASLEAGVAIVLATPLRVRDTVFGALNIYGTDVEAFGEEALANARIFAEQAGVVLTNAIAYAGAESLNSQLRDALDTRDLIGQAKGILMERQGVTAGQAFELLRKRSQRSNQKLFDVASDLVGRVESRDKKTS